MRIFSRIMIQRKYERNERMQFMNNQGRTAIVTGASKGIGAGIAKQLALDGFQTIINYFSSEAEAHKVVAAIEAAGGSAKAIRADVADSTGVKSLFDKTEAEFGPVDVLVNNAGVLKTSPLAEVTDEDYQHLIAVNLTGAFYGMREAAKRVRDGGRIINLSTSIIGHYIPAHAVYAATKAAVEAMTHVLAKELGSRHITVNAVAPGPIATELFFTGKSPELIQRLTQEIPLGRLGEPDDIGRVISFLASRDSGWVNGQVIKANGGRN
jgi:3-oxoacyl-[acyl-carrier protein] reductase